MKDSLHNSGRPNRTGISACGWSALCLALLAATASSAQEPLRPDLFNHLPAQPAPIGDYESNYESGDQGADHGGSWLKPTCEYIHCWMQEWHGGFNLGLNGTAGNTGSTNLATTLQATRAVGATSQSLDAFYFFTHGRSSTNANNLYARFRNEVALADMNVNWFFDAWYQYNQFNNSFFGFNTGVSRNLIDDGITKIAPRIGFGVPDLYLGLSFERQLTPSQRIFAMIDYYPDFSFSDNRVNLYTGWEVQLDDHGLNLQLAVWDWYNRTDNKKGQSNDIMYLMMVGKSF